MERLLEGLRAAAEPTRLRLLALCAQAELTVTDLTQILGQSQPRVSRHLKLLCDAGLVDRFREGTWAFYRLAQRGEGARLAGLLVAEIPADDAILLLDLARLEAVREARAANAAAYFRTNADQWDSLRRLHADDLEVEGAILARLGDQKLADYLDIGTGTGRLLEVIGGRAERALGVDLSREMLAVARTKLEQAGLRNCSVRQADLYQLPLADGSFDAVTMHQVLHYLDDPAAALAEAARVLRPGGRLVVVDFAPHDREDLRNHHAHRRLGFSAAEVADWCRQIGLIPDVPKFLPGGALTVTVWSATRPFSTPAGATPTAPAHRRRPETV